jgi:hypothetical protein
MGGPAAGKTTIRKQKYSGGYVLIDVADIFLSLNRGDFLPLPEAFKGADGTYRTTCHASRALRATETFWPLVTTPRN